MRRTLMVTLMLALCTPVLAAAQGGSQAQIDPYALKFDGRTVEVLFRVVDRTTNRDIQGITNRDLNLLEDDTAISGAVELSESKTDAANPLLHVAIQASPNGAAPVAGSKPVDLSVVGATIGIVFDASTLTNVAGDPTDYVARGRQLLVSFLDAGRTTAAANPEAIGLFLPLSVPAVSGEQIRPADLPGFGQDRNAVINVLNRMSPRTGKTNVFDTLSVAVGATADAAAQRGTDAYVLVVTDGGDSTSMGSYDALVAEALERKVRLLILGVGPQKRLAANASALTTLATKTGGAYLGNPEPTAIQDFYLTNVGVTGQSAYTLRYTSSLIEDGKSHHLVIQLTGPTSGSSEPIPLGITSGQSKAHDLSQALRTYALWAIPMAIVLSLVLTGLLALLQRSGGGGRSSSLGGGITRR
ncbi:MAG: VWA domain-containing protein [Oscillochloris sp.]|nr:VWA domain-containing protein [Oscillochloris sp.]